MNKFRCAIIKNKEVSSEILESHIKRIPQLTLVKVIENSREALEYLDRTCIHLIFVEMQMPQLNGLDLIEKLREKSSENLPTFIVMVEDPADALSVYEKGALGYLVKPIVFEKFKITVERVIETLQKSLHSGLSDNNEYFFIESEGAIVKMRYRDIVYLECDGNYIKIIEAATKRMIYNKPMHYMESILSSHGFIRVHKSYLISIHHIHIVRGNEVMMNTMKDERKVIPIGPTYKNEVQKRIQIV